MSLSFKFIFSKEIPAMPVENVLENFRKGFYLTYCEEIKQVESNKIHVMNGFFHNFNSHWNMWTGVGDAWLTVTEKKDNRILVEYEINYSYFVIMWSVVFSFIVFSSIVQFTHYRLSSADMILSGIIILSLLISFEVLYWRHWSFFRRALSGKYVSAGNYNWPQILSDKTDEELRYIASGKSMLNSDVAALAKKELEKRKQQ